MFDVTSIRGSADSTNSTMVEYLGTHLAQPTEGGTDAEQTCCTPAMLRAGIAESQWVDVYPSGYLELTT